MKTSKSSKTTPPKSSELSAKIINLDSKELGQMALPEEIFGQKLNKNLLAQYVRVYLANQRQGTHNTKTRSQVKYSTRKIYRQKGTGRARHGSRRAPIFVGGGVAFGPHPTDHSLSMNKKMLQAALLVALSQKASKGAVVILSDFENSKKTRDFVAFAKKLETGFNRLLLLSALSEANERKTVRNLKNMTSMDTQSVNTYEVLRAKLLVLTQKAFDELTKNFVKNSSELTS